MTFDQVVTNVGAWFGVGGLVAILGALAHHRRSKADSRRIDAESVKMERESRSNAIRDDVEVSANIIHTYEQVLEPLRLELQRLSDRCSAQETRIDSLTQQNDAQAVEIRELESKVAGLTVANFEEIARLRTENLSLRGEIAMLHQQIRGGIGTENSV